MSEYKIYLAGPISGITYDEGEGWRDVISMNLPEHIKVLSPLRGHDFLKDYGIICGASKNNHPLVTDSAIVSRDRRDIMLCDAVIMNLLDTTSISIGTMIEVGWIDAYRKPLILVMANTGNIHEHSMLRAIASYRVDDIYEAIKIAKIMLTP